MYHGNEIDHRTKDCLFYIDTKCKMNQDTTQPSPQLQSMEVNHTIQWAPHNQQCSPSTTPPPALSNTTISKYSNLISGILPNIPVRHYQPSLTSANSTNNLPPTPHQATPMPTKLKLSKTHHHLHLRNKHKNTRNNQRIFPPTIPY
jgi:hypothetical protein